MSHNADQLGRRMKMDADLMVRPKYRINTAAKMSKRQSNHPMEPLHSKIHGTPGGELMAFTTLSSTMRELVYVTCIWSLTELSQTWINS